MKILLVLLLIAVIILLILYYIECKKSKSRREVSGDAFSAKIIQDMFEILGSTILSAEKIENLNKRIISSDKMKYSTISIYDGYGYEVKASNVEEVYKEIIGTIVEDSDFKSYSNKNTSKYITSENGKTLNYKTAIERNIKSALFSPIYFNDTYLGFWLIESDEEKVFDDMSNEELAKLKNNLGIFIERVISQNVIEIAQNTDKQTGLYNTLYLYSTARQKIIMADTSAFVLFSLKKLDDINQEYGRNIGNILLLKVVNAIKEVVSSNAIAVRYSGTKILVIGLDSNSELIHGTIENCLDVIKNLGTYVNEQKVGIDIQVLIHTFKRQGNIEKEVQKMVAYVDNIPQLNTIKVI